MERRHDWITAVRLGCFSYPPHFITANKLLPFDSKQRSQAPLINSINRACIHLGDCPAFKSV